jgi:hypothetical protein
MRSKQRSREIEGGWCEALMVHGNVMSNCSVKMSSHGDSRDELWHRAPGGFLGRPASECGRLCHGPSAPRPGRPRPGGLMLPI